MMKLKLVPFLVKLMKLVAGIISSILLLSLILFFWIQSIDEDPYFDRKLNHDLLAEVTTTGLNLPSRGNNVYINNLLIFNSYGLYVDDIKKFNNKIVIYLKRDLQVKKDEDIKLNLHSNKYTINRSIYYIILNREGKNIER